MCSRPCNHDHDPHEVLCLLSMRGDPEGFCNQLLRSSFGICDMHRVESKKVKAAVSLILIPTPAPSRPWRMVATDNLVIGDYYSKMFFTHKFPSGQTNAAKTIAFLKDIYEHGIPEMILADNGIQFDCHGFREFCEQWNIQLQTSSPHYPQSNGFTESMVKIVKHALQHTKYSGSDTHLALLDLRVTPVDARLPSPAEMLYQRRLPHLCPSRSTIQTQQQIKFVKDLMKYPAAPRTMWILMQKPWPHSIQVNSLPSTTLYRIWVPAEETQV